MAIVRSFSTCSETWDSLFFSLYRYLWQCCAVLQPLLLKNTPSLCPSQDDYLFFFQWLRCPFSSSSITIVLTSLRRSSINQPRFHVSSELLRLSKLYILGGSILFRWVAARELVLNIPVLWITIIHVHVAVSIYSGEHENRVLELRDSSSIDMHCNDESTYTKFEIASLQLSRNQKGSLVHLCKVRKWLSRFWEKKNRQINHYIYFLDGRLEMSPTSKLKAINQPGLLMK
jgi:hypothetical protein